VTDADYAAVQENPGSGIVAPGGDHPQGNITCDGQVCGSVRWVPGNPPDQQMDTGGIIPSFLGEPTRQVLNAC